MKFLSTITIALILSGCAANPPISFSPSSDYAISVRSSLFDAVRIDKNDTSLFRKGNAIGFIRIEPVPATASSASNFLSELRSNFESEDGKTTSFASYPSGFTGFAIKYRHYLTGYLVSKENPNEILILSFPEGEFDKISKTVSPGI